MSASRPLRNRRVRRLVAPGAVGAAIAIGSFAMTPAAGASTDPVPFSWTFLHTEVPSPTINLNLPTPTGSSSSYFFVGSQQVYGAPPGVATSYTSFGIHIPL